MITSVGTSKTYRDIPPIAALLACFFYDSSRRQRYLQDEIAELLTSLAPEIDSSSWRWLISSDFPNCNKYLPVKNIVEIESYKVMRHRVFVLFQKIVIFHFDYWFNYRKHPERTWERGPKKGIFRDAAQKVQLEFHEDVFNQKTMRKKEMRYIGIGKKLRFDCFLT